MAHKARYFVATAIIALIASGQAQAQDTPATATTTAADDEEIVVTARKRQETLLQTPVIETVIQQEQLERLQTRDIKDIGKLVPGLNFGNGVGLSGVQLSIRGVGTTTADPAIEQTVALNIDGVQMSQGLAFASGMFDTAQVEVLKGPQALFYGKAAPGGVISLRTADPTDKFELIARAGYEFEAEEKRGELIISGPLGSTLKARLSGMYTRQNGFFHNDAVPFAPATGPFAATGTGALAPKHDIGAGHSYILRGTLLWEPEDTVTVRLKANITRDKIFYSGTDQKASCPDGITSPLAGLPFIGGGEDCKLDNVYRIVSMNPAAFPTVSKTDLEPVLNAKQRYGSLEINGRPSERLTLTSVTGYYHLDATNLSNGTNTTSAGASIIVPNSYSRTDWTQEVRLNTDFSGPINLTAGIFYQDTQFSFTTEVATNRFYTTILPTLVPAPSSLGVPLFVAFGPRFSFYTMDVDVRTFAPFAQLRWNPTPELEIAAGARWTSDKRSQIDTNRVTGVPTRILPVQLTDCVLTVKSLCKGISSKSWQPELTITYKPSNDLTIFGSLKKGNKPGSFNVGATPSSVANNAYGDETVKGGEFGVKGRLFDRSLTFDVATYYYKYTGLQVGVIEPSSSGVPAVRTVNAGSAKVYGVDFAFTYRPPQLEGLALHFNGEYNHGRFGTLNNVACWGGQMISEGCNQFFTPAAAFLQGPAPPLGPPANLPGSTFVNGQWGYYSAQTLNGSRLPRAPDWQLNFGFDYTFSLSNGMNLVFANNNAFYSRYVMFPGTRSDFFQGSFIKSDVSLTLRGREDRWEAALIGKNVFNKISRGSCSNANYALGSVYNSSIFGTNVAQITGGTVRGIGGVDEVGCRTDRGRELWVRLTLRPFN